MGVIHDKCNNERALPRLLTSELFLSLFFFDALAHFISSALTSLTPLPTCPTKPPPLDNRARRFVEGGGSGGRRCGGGEGGGHHIESTESMTFSKSFGWTPEESHQSDMLETALCLLSSRPASKIMCVYVQGARRHVRRRDAAAIVCGPVWTPPASLSLVSLAPVLCAAPHSAPCYHTLT